MFFEAQVISQELKRGDDNRDKQGHVYLYPESTLGMNNLSWTQTMTYLPYQSSDAGANTFKKKLDANASDIQNYFSINPQGQLVLATLETTTVKTERKKETALVANTGTTTTYKATEVPIDYKSMISQYATPMSFYLELGMVTRNPEFLAAVVSLVKSKTNIQLTVLNTTTTKTTTQVDEETLHVRERKKRPIRGGGVRYVEDSSDVTTTTTTTTTVKTVTPTVKVTSVDTWICSQKITYSKIPGETIEQEPYTIPRESDKAESLSTDTKKEESVSWTTRKDSIVSVSNTSETYDSGIASDYIDNTDGFIALLDEEHTIPNSKEKRTAGAYLKTDAELFFQLLSQNPETQGMEPVMRYIMQKYDNTRDYGVTELDFSVYDPNYYTNYSNGVYGSSIQEKVWFALLDLGISKEAAAGAMGNIHYESISFNPKMIEDGYNENNGGIGICQWTNNNRGSTGRNTQLKAFAESKEVTWQDEDIQVLFLIGELSPGGGAEGKATYQLLDRRRYYSYQYAYAEGWKQAKDVETATKAFCYSFERPMMDDAKKSMDTRIKWANYYYNKFQDAEKPKAANLLAAADKVAKYVEANNYTYKATDYVNYTFPIQNSSNRTLSCSSYVQQCLLEAGYSQCAGNEKIWARKDPNLSLQDFKKLGINVELITDMNQLQPGDILQYRSVYHVVIVYAVNNNNVVVKGVPEVLNSRQGFNGKSISIDNLKNTYNCYAIRIIN